MRAARGRRRQRHVSPLVWNILRQSETPLSAPDLQRATGADLCAIHKPLRAWAGAGIITVVEGRPKRFVMPDTTERTVLPPTVHHTGRVSVRPRSSRDRIWSALRALKTFDLVELRIASTATDQQTRSYINALVRGGYLNRIPGGDACPRYRLAKPCGPKAPVIRQHMENGRWVRSLRDPATGAIVRLSPEASSDALSDGGVS